MGEIIHIESEGQWQGLLKSSTVVVADFHADWCGPCKMIAPHFESLATKYAKPGKIAFVKVDVDRQQAVASAHGVRAMPTFLVFKSGALLETVQGANPPALTAAVEKAVKLAGTAAPGASFKTPGRTLGAAALGGGAAGPTRGARSASAWGGSSRFSFGGFLNTLIAFIGMWALTLFSFDPYKTAENSDFNVHKPRAPPKPIALGGQKAGGRGGAARPSGGVKTLADLGAS